MNGAEECHFIGHLAKEQDACVAMTGCVGSEDIDFTIMSSHATKSAMFKWSKDGHVEIIESPFKVNEIKKINPGLANKDYKFGLQTGQIRDRLDRLDRLDHRELKLD